MDNNFHRNRFNTQFSQGFVPQMPQGVNGTYHHQNKLYFQDEVKRQMPDRKIKYTTRKSYVLINSKDRDFTAYPQPENYVVKMPTTFRDVVNIKLVSGTVPDLNNARDEPFLILDIDELNNTYSRIYSTNQQLNIFDLIRFSDNVTSSKHIYVQEGKQNMYKPYMGTLDRMTIKIKDQDGALFSFGDDTITSDARQNSFFFEISEVVTDTNILDTQPLLI